jgi:hypothetical protein
LHDQAFSFQHVVEKLGLLFRPTRRREAGLHDLISPHGFLLEPVFDEMENKSCADFFRF